MLVSFGDVVGLSTPHDATVNLFHKITPNFVLLRYNDTEKINRMIYLITIS